MIYITTKTVKVRKNKVHTMVEKSNVADNGGVELDECRNDEVEEYEHRADDLHQTHHPATVRSVRSTESSIKIWYPLGTTI